LIRIIPIVLPSTRYQKKLIEAFIHHLPSNTTAEKISDVIRISVVNVDEMRTNRSLPHGGKQIRPRVYSDCQASAISLMRLKNTEATQLIHSVTSGKNSDTFYRIANSPLVLVVWRRSPAWREPEKTQEESTLSCCNSMLEDAEKHSTRRCRYAKEKLIRRNVQKITATNPVGRNLFSKYNNTAKYFAALFRGKTAPRIAAAPADSA
jgi:hypothetical protein